MLCATYSWLFTPLIRAGIGRLNAPPTRQRPSSSMRFLESRGLRHRMDVTNEGASDTARRRHDLRPAREAARRTRKTDTTGSSWPQKFNRNLTRVIG